MRARPIEGRDWGELRRLFAAQGFDYELPERASLVAALAIEAGGEIVQAVLARPTVELYFLGRENWKTPARRMAALRILHEAMRRELRSAGFLDAHVWIPPEKKNFVSRLMRSFGWTQPLWTNLARSTAPIVS
jgi:hypothetical protein